MKIAFAADLHLRENIWVKHPSIRYDTFMAFRTLCLRLRDLTRKGERVILILGGDIFDSPFPSGQCEKAFVDALSLCPLVDVFFISGNHDLEKTARPSLWNCRQLTRVPEEVEGVTICGLDYTRNKEKLQEELSNIPACDFLVLHSPFRHLLGFAGKWQLEKDDIPPQVGKVLVGDVHVHNITDNIYSPGSLCVNGISEFESEHGFYLFDTYKNSCEYIQVYTRPFKILHWPDKDIPHTAHDDLQPVVDIIYPLDKAAEVDAFIESNMDVYFIKNARAPGAISDGGTPIVSESKNDVLADSLERHLHEDPDALVLAADLLLTKDKPYDVIQKAFGEWMNGINKN